MQAVVFRGPGQLAVETMPYPQVQPGDLIVRVRAAAICATDLKIASGGHFKIPPGTTRILGHELAGEVAVPSPEAPDLPPGARVSVAPNIGCGRCDVCVRGWDHLCSSYDAIGITFDGAMAEYVRIPVAAVRRGQVTPLPEAVSFEEAALVEPLSCVFNAHESVGLGGGDRMLVFGAGPMGLMHLLMGRALGAGAVVMVDPLPHRRHQATQLGADGAVAPEGVAEAVRQFTGGKGFDVVVVAVPAREAQEQATDAAAVRGRMQLFSGLPGGGEARARLDTNAIHYRQLAVTGTTGSSVYHYRRTLELVRARRIDVRPLISDRFTLEEAMAAFARARSGEALKVVLEMPPEGEGSDRRDGARTAAD